ncbi:PSP proline-rich domain-containing protein [Perkinsela sp. CCAP 1560/4]|nr:PSP proline-rich domain-containing protein [Perkinsela sp. CCAP 1560/4]|eukprot:KNH01732.1 PSP proline-rich domain-containing protein [Perkinsela sp. CCAP 1560/4]
MGTRIHKRKRKDKPASSSPPSHIIHDVPCDPTVKELRVAFEPIESLLGVNNQQVKNDELSGGALPEARPTEEYRNLSKRQQRKVEGWTIGKLKLVLDKPELVETHDDNAQYPLSLLEIKAARNVPKVTPNWCIRRKYLSRKRQLNLLTNYELPPQLAATRVASIRKYYVDRARALINGKAAPPGEPPRPDFDAIRDCFYYYTFVHIYRYGDLYYEGREAELDSVDARPGVLSNRLRTALHMPLNVVYPPPWLTHMQVHGPPPGYPTRRFPGVNAPLPKGERWGLEDGQWGRPPTDGSHPRGKWGDLFVHASDVQAASKLPWEKSFAGKCSKPSPQMFSTVVDNRCEKIVGVASKRGQVSGMTEFTMQRRAVASTAKSGGVSQKLPDVVTVQAKGEAKSFSKPIELKHGQSKKPVPKSEGQKGKGNSTMRF